MADNTALFQQQLKKKILVIDGAMGTMLQDAELTAEDFGGPEFEGCNEILTETRPDLLLHIHRTYLKAKADIIETNTFGATSIVLAEYDIADRAYELNVESAKLARQAADEFSTDEWPRFVAGSMGPTTKTLSVTGGSTFEKMADAYEEQARGLIDGGADLLLLETSQDMLNVKAGFNSIARAFEKTGKKIPLMLSGTIEPMGTTLAGQNIEAFYLSAEHMEPVSVGLNCATGPEFMTDHLRTLSGLATAAVSCYPNAGLPDEEGHYHETPELLAKKLAAFAEKGWVNIVGGCCGTTPAHIEAIAEAVGEYEPRQILDHTHGHAVSGIEPLVYDESMRPLLVGERTNVIGSKKFKRLIREEKFEEASEVARAQVKAGAHVIDVCLADPDREEVQDMDRFIREVVKKVKVPLVIDSTDEDVIERALLHSQGKAIINSINLEDGEERFAAVVPLLKKYGGAVVVGTIDEEGMAVTAERKLEVARRSHDLLVNKYGLQPSDLIFDPLVFPVGTGDEEYIGSAEATVEGIRLIKEALPESLTILGVSNVSFGLPPVGREVLNAVYMYHCTKAGLDYAIVNTEKLERYASIPEEEVKLADDLLFNTNDETLAAFTAFYRGKKKESKVQSESLTLEERLSAYIIEGTKEGLYKDLDEALEKYEDPLDIINGPLMDGMAEVGRLFNDNQLIVAEVLQSAEAMKAAVSHLEPYMETNDNSSSKGKVLLATVKGDVHDIGKNLVDIILSNNGFNVVDLGIKVTPAELIEAIRNEKPDLLGLSGLLVKSAREMVITAQDLKASGIELPILVGGAALSRKFTDGKIAPEYGGPVIYAKDAMQGLSLANDLQNESRRAGLLEQIGERQSRQAAKAPAAASGSATAVAVKTKKADIAEAPVYVPKDTDRHILKDIPVAHLLPYVNMQMLLGHHLGLKGKVNEMLADKHEKAVVLKEVIDGILAEHEAEPIFEPAGVYQFFPAQEDGDTIFIYQPDDHAKVLETFEFPRQNKPPHLCLSDFLRGKGSGTMDYAGFMAVTSGRKVREKAEEYKANGEFLKSHAVQALALELAEGFAERMHQLMRDQWGFPDRPDMTMQERFSAKYQGQRFSFGYPACPDLEDQEKLFRLITPEDAGIDLTDGFMMSPEASVSAMVFAHPQARYFNVL
ncbi:methionine synthase [Bacillus marinisedimentorum]|uniref:methionine synthase n=1 Tax=Bacillus marinisedimentorum TaxID=1821260 RepID=UPI0008728CE7|nr:methionine synthase [Bacillus marinisedimentorum]